MRFVLGISRCRAVAESSEELKELLIHHTKGNESSFEVFPRARQYLEVIITKSKPFEARHRFKPHLCKPSAVTELKIFRAIDIKIRIKAGSSIGSVCVQ